VIDQNLKLLLRAFGCVAAGQDRAIAVIRTQGQAVAPRSGDDVLAGGAENGDVLDEALAAYMKTPRQFAPANGRSVSLHPGDDPVTALAGGIRMPAWERFVVRRCVGCFHITAVLSDI